MFSWLTLVNFLDSPCPKIGKGGFVFHAPERRRFYRSLVSRPNFLLCDTFSFDAFSSQRATHFLRFLNCVCFFVRCDSLLGAPLISCTRRLIFTFYFLQLLGISFACAILRYSLTDSGPRTRRHLLIYPIVYLGNKKRTTVYDDKRWDISIVDRYVRVVNVS